MGLPIGLFALVTAAIAAFWAWLGAPMAMPNGTLSSGERLYCLSYTPFRGNQSPLDPATFVSRQQIEDDLLRLAPLTDCIRTYSTRNGLDQVAEIAGRHGLGVIQGIWLGGDAAAAERDLARAVDIANRYPQVVRSVVVGNEVLLRGEMTAADLAATIRRVKAAVPVPVTYADVWEFWLRYREVYDAVDFVTIHILPYWEDYPIPAREAAAHVASIRRRVAEVFPNKEIFLGETGWPSAGRMREGALPSPANQARVIQELLAVAKRENFNVNLIEAFDQPWKRQLEGTVGGHWGLLDAASRTPKFGWGKSVSNHPNWPLQAAGGIGLAAVVFAAAFSARRRDRQEREAVRWLGVAAIALGSGSMVGWAVENVPLESLGAGGWTRSLVMVALAILGPIAAAAVLMRRLPMPAFHRVLGRPSGRPADALSFLAGLLLVAVSAVAVQVALGLVFDPRYRDFPFAPLTGAVVPFLVLSLFGAREKGRRGNAETATAFVLGASVVYFAPNETLSNWQSLWFAAILLVLAVILLRQRGEPG